MRLVGEMVVTRARLEDTLRHVESHVPFQHWRALQEHGSRLERQLRDLRKGVMRVRLVPVGEISAAADGMRLQSDQTSRALVDQSRTMRDMTAAAQNTVKLIRSIAKANVEHSAAAAALLTSLGETSQITDRNASGVRQTRGGTDDLMRRAQALINLMERPSHGRDSNGRSTRSSRS